MLLSRRHRLRRAHQSRQVSGQLHPPNPEIHSGRKKVVRGVQYTNWAAARLGCAHRSGQQARRRTAHGRPNGRASNDPCVRLQEMRARDGVTGVQHRLGQLVFGASGGAERHSLAGKARALSPVRRWVKFELGGTVRGNEVAKLISDKWLVTRSSCSSLDRAPGISS